MRRAVATRNLSAGSRYGKSGKLAESSAMAGLNSATCTPRRPMNAEYQSSTAIGVLARVNRPPADNKATSQADTGETNTPSRPAASRIARSAPTSMEAPSDT